SAKAAPGKPKSMAQKLQACLEIDDGTKDRLNCYDAVIAPKPNPKAKAPAKSVTECNGFKDEEARLTCFNGFADKTHKLPALSRLRKARGSITDPRQHRPEGDAGQLQRGALEVDHVVVLDSFERQRDHVGSEQRLERRIGVVPLRRHFDVD